jgi:hypothetical protein
MILKNYQYPLIIFNLAKKIWGGEKTPILLHSIFFAITVSLQMSFSFLFGTRVTRGVKFYIKTTNFIARPLTISIKRDSVLHLSRPWRGKISSVGPKSERCISRTSPAYGGRYCYPCASMFFNLRGEYGSVIACSVNLTLSERFHTQCWNAIFEHAQI